MGRAYRDLLESDRDYLMLQLQSYAACDDEIVRARVRRRYAELVALAGELSGAESERLDEFFRRGMALNVAAALGVEELSVECPWVAAEREVAQVG
jgi:sugar phosphate isomerase/epimerase